MWDVSSSVRAITASVWDVAASVHDVQALCGIVHPLTLTLTIKRY